MTRRPLRKIGSGLDLARHFLTVEQLPTPWNDNAVFQREAPLEIEIGSGKGLFLANAAATRPEHNFLGIEVAERYARHCAARLARADLPNARMINADAGHVISEFLPDQCATAVHVYFPDPWWKNRHKKRRVMNPTMVGHIERILKPGGKLHFWTDVEEYFQAAIELIHDTTQLDGPHDVVEQQPDHDLDFRTHFERRTRLHGEPVYRAEFHKLLKSQPNELPTPRR